jgi:hypothetical protein
MGRTVTPENQIRNRRICEMRRKGVEPADIAREMHLTRNTVLGVLFRAGLTDSWSPKAAGRGGDYSAEFKRQVVRAALEAGNVHQTSLAWGVTPGVANQWVKGRAVR